MRPNITPMNGSNFPRWACLSTWPFNFSFAHVAAAHLAAQATANFDLDAALSSQVKSGAACQSVPVPIKRRTHDALTQHVHIIDTDVAAEEVVHLRGGSRTL